jgi:hypothetical protein
LISELDADAREWAYDLVFARSLRFGASERFRCIWRGTGQSFLKYQARLIPADLLLIHRTTCTAAYQSRFMSTRPRCPKAHRHPSQRYRRAGKPLLWIKLGSLNHSAELTRNPSMPHGLVLRWLRKEPDTTSPNEQIRRRQTSIKAMSRVHSATVIAKTPSLKGCLSSVIRNTALCCFHRLERLGLKQIHLTKPILDPSHLVLLSAVWTIDSSQFQAL